MRQYTGLTRRQAVATLGAAAAATILKPFSGWPHGQTITKAIPSTGEPIPVVGLGTWITFNVGDDPELREECAGVMKAFFDAGGRLIDSSPMYGSSQAVIGYGLSRLPARHACFRQTRCGLHPPREGPSKSKTRGSTGESDHSTCCKSIIFWHGKIICRCSSL